MAGIRSQIHPYVTVLAVVLVTGLVHGLWTQRWTDDSDLQAAVARFKDMPLIVGAWHGEELEIEPAKLARAEVAGYLLRRYTNQATGQSVNVILLCGRFGPLSVHTPDVCFDGAGFQTMEKPLQVTVQPADEGPPAMLWTARFEKKTGPLSQYFRAFWSWSTGPSWQAPQYPRLVFRAAPTLFKLYVFRDMARPDESLDAEPGVALLKVLLPQLSAALAAS